MLEVVESDFGRSLAQAETTEATKAEEYDSMTKQNKLTKVQKDADQKFKSKHGRVASHCALRKTAQSLDKAVVDLTSDKDANKEELAAVESYKESLQKQCADGGMSYAERAAKREEEIQGLKVRVAGLRFGDEARQDALASLGGIDLNAVLLQSTALREAVCEMRDFRSEFTSTIDTIAKGVADRVLASLSKDAEERSAWLHCQLEKHGEVQESLAATQRKIWHRLESMGRSMEQQLKETQRRSDQVEKLEEVQKEVQQDCRTLLELQHSVFKTFENSSEQQGFA
eukprot:g20305.t2